MKMAESVPQRAVSLYYTVMYSCKTWKQELNADYFFMIICIYSSMYSRMVMAQWYIRVETLLLFLSSIIYMHSPKLKVVFNNHKVYCTCFSEGDCLLLKKLMKPKSNLVNIYMQFDI